MADPREICLQAVRTWLKACFSLPDERVILKQYGALAAPRQTKTYFMVEFMNNTDRGLAEDTITPTETTWGIAKHATIRVSAVGSEAGHWLDAAGLLTHEFNSPDVTINEPLSGVMETAVRHGNNIEYGSARDFLISYKLTVDTAPPATVATDFTPNLETN